MKKILVVGLAADNHLVSWLRQKFSDAILEIQTSIDKVEQKINRFKPDLVIGAPGLLLSKSSTAIPEALEVVSTTHQGIMRVPLQQVRYFKADQKYILVVYETGQFLMQGTLSKLAEEYKPWFVKIHRNLLVKKSEITCIERAKNGRCFVQLKGSSEPLWISRRQLPRVRELFKT